MMIDLLATNKRIINIDESWVSETEYSRRMWCPNKVPCTATEQSIGTRLALIAALDTEGRVYFALTHANTDSDVILTFLRRLAIMLSIETPDWRETSIVLLDGAKYHTSKETRENLKKLKIPITYSAPYCYSTAPIEHLFGGFKQGEFQSNTAPRGKK